MAGDRIYYILVLISFLFLLFKFRDYFSWFVILLFYDGLFAFLGSNVWNTYKSILPLYAIFIIIKTHSLSRKNMLAYKGILLLFLTFSISFFISAVINDDNLTLILNQYSKFFIFILCFFILKRLVAFPFKLQRLSRLLIVLLVFQGILTVIKFYLFGVRESVIGTVAYIGGAAGTVLPVLGFIFIWVIKKGKLKFMDWGFIVLLLLIGIVSMKRAIWFVMPVVVFLFMHYIPGRRLTKKSLIYIPIALLIFYFGIRLNPTLNPDYDYWGRFDARYAYNYAVNYSFGNNHKDGIEGGGRVGGTLKMFKSLIVNKWNENTFFGFGLKEIFATDTEEFDAKRFGIDHKGFATGIIQSYIAGGLFMVIFIILLAAKVVFSINDRRIRNVLMLIFIWEFVFYTGIILRTSSLTLLFVFCIVILGNQAPSTEKVHNVSIV